MPGDYDTLRKDASNRGIQVAIDLLASEPELGHTEQFYMTCFSDLACDRPVVGMGGYGLLSRSTIREYGKELGFERDNLEYFYKGVRCAERELTRLQRHEDKKSSNK